MKRAQVALLVASIGAWCVAPLSSSAQGLRVQPGERSIEWTVCDGTNQVLVYSFDPAKFKPYVKELRTITGQNLLRDAPFDHLHHHALMYGIRVNGLNFWEETPGNGVQKPVASPAPELTSSPRGLPQARIHQTIHWLKPDDAFLPDTAAVALLIERRTLTLTVDKATREVALEWSSEFEVGRKTNEVTLTGANYHGLGVRFRQDLDSLATHSRAGTAVDLSHSRQDTSPAPWESVNFDAPSGPATFAIVGHSSNRRGDPIFFAMKTPFAYLSATQGLDKEPLIYRTGDKFNLRYLVLVYPDFKTADALNRRSQAWLEGH